jgi:hypothetical protein
MPSSLSTPRPAGMRRCTRFMLSTSPTEPAPGDHCRGPIRSGQLPMILLEPSIRVIVTSMTTRAGFGRGVRYRWA